MNPFNSTYVGGLATQIVSVLRQFGRPIPVGYLARTLGRGTQEIRGDLQLLEGRGVVRLFNDGDEAFVALR